MIKAVFFNGTEEMQTIEGDGIIATAIQGNLQRIAVTGRFNTDDFMQSIATMAVKAARAFYEIEKGTPADQFVINTILRRIIEEAESSSCKTVAEEVRRSKNERGSGPSDF